MDASTRSHPEDDTTSPSFNDKDAATRPSADSVMEKGAYDNSPHPFLTWRTLVMGILVSMGGLIFGYDTGQISGFLAMDDFLRRFGTFDQATGKYVFSDVRSGLIVGLVRS